MTKHDLFILLVAGGVIFWLGMSGLRINDKIRASNAHMKMILEEAESGGMLRISPQLKKVLVNDPRDWPWISYEVLGGLICLGALGWYFWSLLPQAPM